MELDFTKLIGLLNSTLVSISALLFSLYSLAFMDFKEIPTEKQPSKTLSEPFIEPEEYKTPPKEENALQGQINGLEGIPILQRQADAKKQDIDRSLAIYKEYQQNTKTSSQLQNDILKGLKAGEDIYSLFLKATKAISLMTSNSVFYSQTEEDLKAIYGRGLQEKPPLQIELEEVQERLQRLREAEKREQASDSKERIQRAIQAHENKATELRGMIEKTQL